MLTLLLKDRYISALWLTAFVTTILFAVYIIVVFIPEREVLNHSREKLARWQADFIAGQHQLEHTQKLKKLQPSLERLNRAINNRYKSTEIASMFYAVAQQQRLIIIDESYHSDPRKPYVQIKLSIEGGYQGVRVFLNQLFELPYVLTINRLDIRDHQDSNVIAKLYIHVFQKDSGLNEG
jgi:Tfp pilus assembly protein PilO